MRQIGAYGCQTAAEGRRGGGGRVNQTSGAPFDVEVCIYLIEALRSSLGRTTWPEGVILRVSYGSRIDPRAQAHDQFESYLDSVPEDSDTSRLVKELAEGLIAELGVNHHVPKGFHDDLGGLLVRGSVPQTGEAVEVQQYNLAVARQQATVVGKCSVVHS